MGKKHNQKNGTGDNDAPQRLGLDTAEPVQNYPLSPEILQQCLNQSSKRIEYLVRNEPIPASLNDPTWVDKALDRISEMDLPLNAKKSGVYRAAAKSGYRLSAARNRFTQKMESLPFEELPQKVMSKQGELLQAELAEYDKMLAQGLVLLSTENLVEFMEGFAYGIRCQLYKIKNREPIGATNRSEIISVIWRHQAEIQELVSKKSKSSEISKFVAERLPKSSGSNSYHKSNIPSDKTMKPGFHDRVYRICHDLGIKFPGRGRPKGK